MLETLGRSLLLALLVLATWRGVALCLRRWWPVGTSPELALGAAVLTALIALAEVGVLGYLPTGVVARPLDGIPWLHLAVLAAIWAMALRRGAASQLPAHPPGVEPAETAATERLSRALFALACAVYAVAGLYAVWSADWLADAINYHVPQILQPWQDGRLGRVYAEPVWADSYPRAASLVKFWAMRLSGADSAVNLVSWFWGLVFVLAVYVAARRAGLGLAASRIAAALAPTAPVFLLLTGIGYADLDVSACLLAGLALLMPPAGGVVNTAPAALGSGALLLAVWMKFSATLPAAVIGVMALAHAAARSGGVGPLRLAGMGVVVAACAAGPYLATWARYGSPIWPIRLEVGGLVVFDGPHAISSLTPAHEQFLPRFGIQWSSWLAPLTPDSPGNLGPLFAIVLLAPTLAGAIGVVLGGRASPFGLWMLGAIVAVIFVGPQLHAGRYGLYLLAPAAVFTAMLLSQIRDARWMSGVGVLVGLLMGANVALWVSGLHRQHETSHAGAGEPANPLVRNKPWQGAGGAWDPRWPSPDLRATVRTLVPPRGLLISAVHGATTYLHDDRYSYRVEFRPMAPWPLDFNKVMAPDLGAENEAQWAAMIRELSPAVVLAYEESSEAKALVELGYVPAMPASRRRGEPVPFISGTPQPTPPGE